MKKRLLFCGVSALVLVVVLLTHALAHSGRTDFAGGHYVGSTGKYHYHHGYSAHQHTDMDGDGDLDCPYEFDDKANQRSPSNSYTTSERFAASDKKTENQTQKQTEKNTSTLGALLMVIFSPILYIAAINVAYYLFIRPISNFFRNRKR